MQVKAVKVTTCTTSMSPDTPYPCEDGVFEPSSGGCTESGPGSDGPTTPQGDNSQWSNFYLRRFLTPS